MDVAPADGNSTTTSSAFGADKLYTVAEDTRVRIHLRESCCGEVRPVILSTRQADEDE